MYRGKTKNNTLSNVLSMGRNHGYIHTKQKLEFLSKTQKGRLCLSVTSQATGDILLINFFSPHDEEKNIFRQIPLATNNSMFGHLYVDPIANLIHVKQESEAFGDLRIGEYVLRDILCFPKER